MLEKLPSGLGRALGALRTGEDKLLFRDGAVTGISETITVSSPAFADGGAIPVRYTADGEGLSPPLAWSGVPPEAAALMLVIEDADSPTPQPLVHAIVWNLPPGDGGIAEGALPGPQGAAAGFAMGRNSLLAPKYLPPDPPPGHGPHRYAFQLYAVDMAPTLEGTPGRGEVVWALRSHVLAKGCLIGTYERD